MINYRDLTNSFDRVSLRDLLRDRVPTSKIGGRIVLIGSITAPRNSGFGDPLVYQLRFTFLVPEVMEGLQTEALRPTSKFPTRL